MKLLSKYGKKIEVSESRRMNIRTRALFSLKVKRKMGSFETGNKNRPRSDHCPAVQ